MNWTAVTECMMEVRDLSRRQVRLGELEQIRSENCMACEEQMRSINHKMNIAKVNDVKSVQQQAKYDEQKETQASIQEAWKSLLDMRNAPEESETVKLTNDNKIEPEAVKLTGDNKMEFDRRPEARDNRMTVNKRPDISRPREQKLENKNSIFKIMNIKS